MLTSEYLRPFLFGRTGASSWTVVKMTWVRDMFARGALPVATSYNVMPKLQTSAEKSYLHIHGARLESGGVNPDESACLKH